MEYAVITGASRGLGRALAYELGAKGTNLFLVVRKKSKKMQKDLNRKGISASILSCDLAKVEKLETLMDKIFKGINAANVTRIILINNAGIILPISFAGKIVEINAVLNNLYVNSIAPIILSNAFIRKTKSLRCNKVIINISSGASVKPIEGWSLYCSSKAAIEMYSRCIQKEQSRAKDGVKVFTFDPGVLNTNMQSKIRRTTKDDFPNVNDFITMYSKHKLKAPSLAAREIYNLFLKGKGNHS